jgi:hypothetical protein
VRTFSALRERCNYPEIIDLSVAKTPSRQKSMDVGTEFHEAVEAWVTNRPLGFFLSKDANKWFEMMTKVWAPPVDCRAEVAIGITTDGRAVDVDEPEPHAYVPRDPTDVLLTAGRLDLEWTEERFTENVVDVKTGRTYLGDPWQIPQLVAQAVSVALRLMAQFSDVSQIKLGVYYARLGLFDYGDGPRPLSNVIAMLPQVHRWATAESDPRPGAHCLGCYSATNCHANPIKQAV